MTLTKTKTTKIPFRVPLASPVRISYRLGHSISCNTSDQLSAEIDMISDQMFHTLEPVVPGVSALIEWVCCGRYNLLEYFLF
ncbi:MAG: hypothetical protein COA78_04360 [Blastopirellula sp.]|nr:MAG: hypothetical protein COA78_04360 [Blastopirellula sp.]